MISHNLGYPRIGEKRELKKATERYWKKEITLTDLEKVGKEIRIANWKTQKKAGIDLIPVNDFSFYDQVLDMSLLLGIIPKRFRSQIKKGEMTLRFLIARGGNTSDQKAGEMTKWFDTNYHYIVPELDGIKNFSISSKKLFGEIEEAKKLGVNPKPVIIGPITFLRISKFYHQQNTVGSRLKLLSKLIKCYQELIDQIQKRGVEWLQIDEPVLSLDLTSGEKKAFQQSYKQFHSVLKTGGMKILLANYFGKFKDNLKMVKDLPVDAIHVDLVRGISESDSIIKNFQNTKKILSLGLVDGRNIWKNDYDTSLKVIKKAIKIIGADWLMIAPSCSLIHAPVTLRHEIKMNRSIKNWFSFAEEKLNEIFFLSKADVETHRISFKKKLLANKLVIEKRQKDSRVHDPRVEKRYQKITVKDYKRISVFRKRIREQSHLNLPEFPTTTIGSFPQTLEIRKMRLGFKKGKIKRKTYEDFLKKEIREVVAIQEKLDLDVLVHGEPERNDMVEYFGEKMNGYVFTNNGWVQSYGSRYVKPPIIYGSVSRPKPMTVSWSVYAKDQTRRPMKGMLTGPITMLQWSFVRNDQPRSKTAFEIALALRDEVVDLEKMGISIIQMDEPAIREGLPLRVKEHKLYLKWAVNAFRLSTAGVKNRTQIHTHMCYSDFNDIIDSIAALDADVISIETSRSQMKLLQCFKDFKYPNSIGPGVYDIHSPRVPTVKEMKDLLKKAAKVIDPKQLWVNPDCGLKTRQWDEVKPALKNMVIAAKSMRE